MENRKVKKISGRSTPAQLKCFVEFCEANPHIPIGRNNSRSPKGIQALWDELADLLNAMRGPTKTATQWRETLTHWKNMVRSRARRLAFQKEASVEGQPTAGTLSDLEERAVAVFGVAGVPGREKVATLGFEDQNSLLPTIQTQQDATIDIVTQSNNTMLQTTPNNNTMPQSKSENLEKVISPVPLSSPVVKRKRKLKNSNIGLRNLLHESMVQRQRMDERIVEAFSNLSDVIKEMATAIATLSAAVAQQKEN
ncbi:uncharacterized protein LOC119679072 [Teleopsis dalmanni]|uniref:uncharacterized protein LOC119679072 n=1 Tax=Teleopsis dalmanni TaxID=139649 RepID=UPI0018CF41F3|nr:uncharacterized protein LOC119679072 [Teleopsis dalmanni]